MFNIILGLSFVDFTKGVGGVSLLYKYYKIYIEHDWLCSASIGK